MKRVFSVLLCIIMVLSVMPVSTFGVTTVPDFSKGGDITLTEDITVDETIELNKETVIDLAGHTITYTGKSGTPLFNINVPPKDSLGDSQITVKNGNINSTYGRGVKISRGNLLLCNVKYTGNERSLDVIGGEAELDSKSVLNTTGSDVAAYIESMQPFSRYIASKLIVNGRIYQSAEVNGNYAITGNPKDGSVEGTIVLNEGSVVESSSAPAIYYPQMGNMIVKGTVIGTTGIEIASCDQIEIFDGAHVIATAPKYSYNPNSIGAHSEGAAIAIIPHPDCVFYGVYILGGAFEGPKAVVADGFPAEYNGGTLDIRSGLFDGRVEVLNCNGKIWVYGGAFNDIDLNSTKILAEDSIRVKDGTDIFSVYGIELISEFFKALSKENPEQLKNGIIEITSAGNNTSYNITNGLTVINKADKAVYVNGEILKQGETIHVGNTDEVAINKRIAGKNRYETAVKTADELKNVLGVNKFDTIIVASGDSYADALAGSYLAKVKKAPILVVNKFNEAPAMEYIKKNIASGGKVYLLGGKGAVSSRFESNAKKICTVERLGGKDRFETNLNILKEAGVGNEELLICSAWDFADSLSASSVGKPILLTDTHLSAVQKNFIKGLKTDKCYLIGGKGAVSSSVQSEVKTIGKRTDRISGANRYDTSVAVAKKFSEKQEKDIVLANGDDFPDGLVGGPLAYFMKSPLILINERNTVSAAGFAKEYASERMVILGGRSLISDVTADKIIQ